MKFAQRTDVSTGGTTDILDVAENHFQQMIDSDVTFYARKSTGIV